MNSASHYLFWFYERLILSSCQAWRQKNVHKHTHLDVLNILTHSTRILFKSMLLILDKLHLNIQASSEWFINTTRHYFYLRCLRKYKKCCFLRVYIIYVLDVDDLSWRLLNAFKSLLFLSRYEINSFQRNLRKGNMIYIHICWGYVHTPY